MTDLILKFLSEPFIMLLLGVVSHFLKELANLKKRAKEGGRPFPSAKCLLSDYWVSMVSMFIGALVGMVGLQQMGELTAMNAFGLGYIANSVGTLFSKKTEATIQAGK